MAGQRGLDRDLRGLQIADLADHDHVRVVAQHRAQDVGEAEPDLRLDLDLVDAVELVLDRVLDGQHLAIRRVQLDQRGIQRGGLAAAGRAGDQDDAVGPVERLAIGPQRLRLEAQRDEVERHAAAIEHAQHHGLAMHGRQGRDAQVDVLAAHRQADAAVLRQPALGDVEPGHDLEPRDDRRAQLGGRRLHVAQHAIDPVARAQALLGRLEVDVGSAQFGGLGDQAVDDAHHRRLARQIAQPLDVVLGAEIGHVAERLDHLAAGAAEQPLERRLDVGRHADPDLHRLAGKQLHGADRVVVERVGHGDHQTVLGIGQRQDARLAQEIGADPVGMRQQIRVVGFGRKRQLEELGQAYGDLALGHHPELGEQDVQAIVACLLDPLRALEATGIQQAARDQQLAKGFVEAAGRLQLAPLADRRRPVALRHIIHVLRPRSPVRTARPARMPGQDGCRTRSACRPTVYRP